MNTANFQPLCILAQYRWRLRQGHPGIPKRPPEKPRRFRPGLPNLASSNTA